MSKRTVISHHSLPTKPPIWPTITLWLLMDRLGAEGWVAGVVWTLWGLLCLSAIGNILKERQVDVPNFGKDSENARS